MSGSVSVLSYREFDFSLEYQGRFARDFNENALVVTFGFM